MAAIVDVHRVDDPRLDDFRDLAVADRRPDRSGGRGLVIAEGAVVVRRLLASPYPLRALLGVTPRIEDLRAAGFRIAALTPRADAVPLAMAALDRGRTAVLLGAEGPGLTDAALAAADLAVRIPMAGGVDSLNVATAAAIVFHAAGRP